MSIIVLKRTRVILISFCLLTGVVTNAAFAQDEQESGLMPGSEDATDPGKPDIKILTDEEKRERQEELMAFCQDEANRDEEVCGEPGSQNEN